MNERAPQAGSGITSLGSNSSAVAAALSLLDDLLDAKRIMPTEYRTLRAALGTADDKGAAS